MLVDGAAVSGGIWMLMVLNNLMLLSTRVICILQNEYEKKG